MLIENLLKIFDRDLNKLKEEILLFYQKELWITAGDVKNSAGNLCLHICGNLKHFIGAVLGNSGFVREREKEFSLKNVPKDDLLKNIDETSEIVKSTLSTIDKSILVKNFPINVFGEEMTTQYFLIHLITHLSYHLGQINYLRRLMLN
ncbi:MAG: DUF1572 family protein [Ignavibacteriae bacterium]|nr:DUF1572 family protein [Ignavibacteriota bacterium]MCB0751318.1 DUF1572 family protein [Ignavibacteriota bacterium]MCB9258468.1 DUF1572 family protein [Ignavibacteriales bacterium]